MTHYETLGVNDTATSEEIKTAYRKLATEHHPDKHSENKDAAEKKFKEINSAYQVLKDDNKRAEYNAQLKNPYANTGGGFHRHQRNMHPDMDIHVFRDVFQSGHMNEDVFSFIFGQAGGFDHIQRNKDHNISLTITLKEAFGGCEKIIQYKESTEIKTVSVKIPKGIRTGNKLKLSGKAPKSRQDMPAGDIIVHVNVEQKDRNFTIVRDNLVSIIEITALDSILGVEQEFTNIDGEVLSVTIPKGTRHTEYISVSKKGMTIMSSDQRGDLILQVATMMPTDLSDTSIKQLTKINESQKKSFK